MAQKTLSELQENFTCLAIVCVDLIKLPLLDILNNHVKPSDLYTELNSSTLISGNKLRSHQKKLCYITPPGIPDYSKFDVSLLYTLIRNLCPSLKPTGRWGEEPADVHTQLGDDVERLRLFRNRVFAHANFAQTSDSDFQNYWPYIQNVITRIQKNKNAGCRTDYRQKFRSIEKRLLNWDDLEKYRLLLDATVNLEKERGKIDEPDIWIKDPEKVVCGSTARFEAVVQGKQVSSVTWQKLYRDKSKQIEKGNQKFWGRTNEELVIESVCKEDEGTYQAVLSIEEDRIRKTIQSNVIFLQVVGGIPDLTTSHETCLQTHSVKLIGNVFLVDDLPVIDDIFWSKDGKIIDAHGNEGKYSKVSVDVPSLTIYNVNQYDAGHYTLTATNAAGTTVSDAIVLGAPEIVLEECEEGSDGCQIFPVTIKSIPTAYNVQWQVANKQSDTLTPLNENAEEYRGTTKSIPHSVLVVRREEQLKNNIYQIKVQNFIGGRIKKISSILNMFYQDRGANARFAKLSNALAKEFPEEKLNQIHDLILDSFKDKLSLEKKETAREYFNILKRNELFTPSDVIFMQFLLRESNCEELYEKCIAYATTQKALCFYEERPRNGYKTVQFHVQGSISDYTTNQIEIIKETVAAIVGCDNEEIHLNGFCKSTSFFVVLSIKEKYINSLFNMKQQDKEKLIGLNINYFIIDSDHVYLNNPKEEEKKVDRKITAPEWLISSINTTQNPARKPAVISSPVYLTDRRKTNKLLIAAIDFGTTFSGYAFAWRSELQNDPSRIRIQNWCSSNGSFVSYKTSSTVLLNRYKQLVDFGFDAESKYAYLLEDGEHEDYFYVRHFKMILYDHAKTEKPTKDLKVSDIRGRELPAVTVFAYAIKYFKDHLLHHVEWTGFGTLKNDDICWVLTVPAIWDNRAKFFMREAAIEAGICSDQLIIALEPEAASIYCKQLPVERLEGANTNSVFPPGSKYLVLDAGGGTVDITVHEIVQNGYLHELERASGGDWGGISVDNAFKNTLAEIVTEELLASYNYKHPSDYIELFMSFETGKRRCGRGQDLNSFITLKIPTTLFQECLETLTTDLITLINKSRFKGDFILKSNYLKISLISFKRFFLPACDGTIKHIKELFQSPKVKDVNKILMVGGFSESYILQEAIRNAFPDCQVIVPIEAGVAVLRGAVLFGFSPNTVNTRIAKHTYGVDMNAIFNPKIKYTENLKRK